MNTPALNAPAPPQILPWELRSEKIQATHRERVAMVYVRQSTPQQVLQHQESTRLQYSLRSRAEQLGWAADRVVVIDDDLGKSGASAEHRAGFQRLVAEVSLGHVGLILGVEMSRLARCCKDWHQLLEVCGLFGTLIADLDGVYDPANYNDRLLLGLKGTMSEAELHILKQRMHQGRLHKARRGALSFRLPTGYVHRPSGEIVLDPDEQVQGVVKLILHKFEELGTLHGLLQYLVRHKIQMGIRVREGPSKGELEWRSPCRMTLQNMLRHPIYAGAYAYGRRQVDARRKQAGRPSTGRRVIPPEDWYVLLKDHVPAYITWEQYEANVARLKANRARADELGAPRYGPALLSGLVICSKCGHRMGVHYGGKENLHTYVCTRMMSDYGGEFCQSVAGRAVDGFVCQQALAALAPAELELSLAAAEHVEAERAALNQHWQQRLERAAYETERAARQYRLVEPENRLVARQLESEWEARLKAQRKLDEEYERFGRQQPRVLSELEREAIRRLAADIPALWAAPTTTLAERKQILRQIIERVRIDAQGGSERVKVVIEWAGGQRTESELIRPVRKLEQLSYYPQLRERLSELVTEGKPAQEIADILNTEGFRPPKRCEHFKQQGVWNLIARLGLRQGRTRPVSREGLGSAEWWLQDLAAAVPMPVVTLYNWLQRGWLQARREEQAPQRWIICADANELERLRELHRRPPGYYTRRLWVEDQEPEPQAAIAAAVAGT